MVAYCVTALGGGTCIDSACLSRHDISRCDICGCSLPNLILEQHQNGKKHIRNLASQGPRNLGTPQQVPPSQLDHQNPQPAPPPNTLPPSGSTPDTIIASDPRLTVSHKGGLDFKVQGTGNAGNLSFSPASLTILIEKTDMISSLSIHSIVPTPNSCFSASQVGETAVIRHKKPRRILVSFQAPHAGTFRASLKITFIDKSRQSDGEFSVIRELLGRAILPGIPASAEDRSNSATGDTVVASEDTGITVSHESGLQFSLERSQSNVQFTPQTEELVIEKSSRSPLVSFETATVRLPDGSTASCFSAEFHGSSKWAKPKSRRTITVSFAPQQEGLYEAILELTFRNHKRKADFVIQRTLRGVAKQPARGHARSSGSFPANDWADDHASLSSDEEEDLPDSDGTGISVSDEDGVYFGIVERRRTNGPFATPMASLTIQHAKGFPAVTFLKAKINTLDNSDPSFIARFEGDTQTIQPSTESAVQIIFNPKFEGQFEAILELIFYDNHRSTRFVVRRRLRAIAGSVEDHKHFESFSQEQYVPHSQKKQYVPPQKVILLWSSDRPRKSRKLPDYELPPIVQAAVDNATEEQPYDKEVPHLIHILRPKELSMDTYAQYFKALLNVDEGHQQYVQNLSHFLIVILNRRDLMDQPPFEVEVQKNRERYSVEIENKDEDLLPEVIIGDFLWLDDKQDDIRYEARITSADVFTKRKGTLSVLKLSLRLPAQFDLYRGATFILRFRLNRITLRRQYHALASSFASLRRLLFPIVTDIKPLQPSPKTEIKLANENIRHDDQQLQTVISILQQPKGNVPFIIYGPPGTGKTSTVVESIVQLVRHDAGVKILACTPSNAAADLLTERLAAAGLNSDELFRLNAYSRYEEDIPEDVQGFSVFPDRAKLLAHRVVLCTCSTAGSLQTLNIPVGHFSHIIVDEAAQAEEPLAMIPIVAFSNEKTNVILAGDPHQLGPVIKSVRVAAAGLGKSYLQRLMRIRGVYGLERQSGKTIVDLQRNRRSHGAIIAWPNRYLYEDIMRAHAKEEIVRVLLDSSILPKKGFPLIFHGVKGEEWRTKRSPSYFNIVEASIVRDYCQKLLTDPERKIYPEEIGVIAPYKAQVRTIRQLLKMAKLSNISVGSVEQFQGQERKVIILATTRSNKEVDKRRAMGFLQNRQRLNVAITRAQALLITIGDPDVLGKDPLWQTFMNYIILRGGWTGKMLSWKPKEEVHVPGYDITPRPGGVVYGKEFIDGKSEKIYRYDGE